MAVSAYILIQTEVGKAAQVASEVGGIDGVVSAEDVTGPYDVVARAESETVDDLGKMVVSRVQMIEGITAHPHLPRRPPLTVAAVTWPLAQRDGPMTIARMARPMRNRPPRP